MALNSQILEKSFEAIKPQMQQFSASFYENLFRNNPELEPMFKNVSIEAQEKKLVASLGLIVENLRNLEELTLALKSLGAHHVTVGTVAEHYPLVGKALLETFATYLGSQWTQELEQNWLDAYTLICKIMLQGAENPDTYLGGELTFYEWLDLYGESSQSLRETIANVTHFRYRKTAGNR